MVGAALLRNSLRYVDERGVLASTCGDVNNRPNVLTDKHVSKSVVGSCVLRFTGWFVIVSLK